MKRLRRILHPTDFSRASGAAFTRAVSLAKENQAELLLLHVLLPPAPFVEDSFISVKRLQDLEAAVRRGVQRQLAGLLAKAKKSKVRARALVLEGVPYAQITRAARTKRMDLIVMGTHGRTGISKVLLGSIAARVIPLASCPVLTVRGN